MADLEISQLAEVTQRHVETLRRLARAGRLPGAYRLGTRWLFRAEALEDLRHGRRDDDHTPPPAGALA